MKTPLKQVVDNVFDLIAEKQFREMENSRAASNEMLDNIPSGKESNNLKVGQRVITTGTGSIKAGFEMEIVEIYEMNGYQYYNCGYGVGKKGGFKHIVNNRQKDIKAVV